MSQPLPHALSASEAMEKINSGLLSAVDLVTDCIKRIDATDGILNAWAHLDREGALARAGELDAIRRTGHATGPLHGIPVGLKDIIDTKTMPTECGSFVFAGPQPGEDAALVNRLTEAGAVIMGKTVTTEMAFMHPSNTCNPHNPAHTPGGSSSGSAAAVAAFQVPLAIGTQTNGSVIRPASFCGTYGFKPTAGTISRHGLLQTSKTLDQVGVFARSMEDTALLSDVLGGYDPADFASFWRPRASAFSGYNQEPPVEPDLVWLDMPYHDRMTADAREGFEELLAALGGRVERFTAPDHLPNLVETQRIIHQYEFVHHLKHVIDTRFDDLSDTLRPIIKSGQAISPDQYAEAAGNRESAISYFRTFFHDYDGIIAPYAAGEAPLRTSGSTSR